MTDTAKNGSPQDAIDRTADHYSKQWGKEINFQDFVEANPDAASAMPGRQLGWTDLFLRIRAAAAIKPTSVYDAGCGFGNIARRLLADPCQRQLDYLGADIHRALSAIDAPRSARIIQADMCRPLPGGRSFDFIVCRAALHHTPDPAQTYSTLASQLAPGGTLAVSVYARKTPMREAVDDALRTRIAPMSNDEAMAVADQFTRLGRDLQACDARINIAEDIPFLGIRAGSYSVQGFIYDHFIKCWHTPAFAKQHCDLVNFDWYHPPFAYRYTVDELAKMATDNDLRIARQTSITAQHYMEAVRLAA